MDKKIFLIFVVGLLLVAVASIGTFPMTGSAVKEFKGMSLCNKDIIVIDLYYSGDFKLLNKSLERGCAPKYLHELDGRYSYELEGGNKILYRAEFNPALIYSDADLGDKIEGGAESAKRNIILAAPSSEEAEKVNVYDNKSKVLEINVYGVGATSCRIE